MRIEARLRESARRFGDKTALVAGASRLSYAELDRLSDNFASGLISLGLTPGDRLVMLLENGQEAVIAFFAAWKVGAIPCPLHPTTKAEKLAAILDSAAASGVLTQGRLAPTVATALSSAGTKPHLIVSQAGHESLPDGTRRYEDLLASDGSTPLPVLDDMEALALLIHTSGSTGHPKGVMLTHANVEAACLSISGYLGNTSGDIVLSVLPLSFGYGITQFVTMTMVGGTLVIEKSFAFPRKILERLSEEKATGFPLVPAMAALINGMKDLQPGFLPHLRYITSAAAAMPPAFTERLQHLLPTTQIFLMYGQTECLRATYLSPEDVSGRPLSVGKAIPGTRAFVAGENGQPASPGTIGELVIEGPHVMQGYWNGDVPDDGRLPRPVRRLHTGDLFRQDEDGFLYFISRRDDIIKTRGEKVSPQEVERVLYALPGIREAAVGGVDDPVFGQTIRAYVVLEDGALLSEREIIRHCAGHLEDYMVPKSVEFRDALPRTTTGKIRLGVDRDTISRGNAA
jgi:acyl-CoA synthetase (AMP-forming)/AMP-acid ligase II